MAMADAQTGQNRHSIKLGPVSRKHRESIQQRLINEERIHAQVFQESTNLGKRADLPSSLDVKGSKPTKKMMTKKASQQQGAPAAGTLPTESVSHRKPHVLADVSTQISEQTASNSRSPPEVVPGKRLQPNRIDFKEEIVSHLIATDVDSPSPGFAHAGPRLHVCRADVNYLSHAPHPRRLDDRRPLPVHDDL